MTKAKQSEPLRLAEPGPSRDSEHDADAIGLLEQRPHPRWFMTMQNEHGETEYWMRFTVTGLHPRFLGPFPTPYHGLQHLDWILDKIGDGLSEADVRTCGRTDHDRFLAPRPTDAACRQFAPDRAEHGHAKEG